MGKRPAAKHSHQPPRKRQRPVVVDEDDHVVPKQNVSSATIDELDRQYYGGRTLNGLLLPDDPGNHNFEVWNAYQTFASATSAFRNLLTRLQTSNRGNLGVVGFVVFRNRHSGIPRAAHMRPTADAPTPSSASGLAAAASSFVSAVNSRSVTGTASLAGSSFSFAASSFALASGSAAGSLSNQEPSSDAALDLYMDRGKQAPKAANCQHSDIGIGDVFGAFNLSAQGSVAAAVMRAARDSDTFPCEIDIHAARLAANVAEEKDVNVQRVLLRMAAISCVSLSAFRIVSETRLDEEQCERIDEYLSQAWFSRSIRVRCEDSFVVDLASDVEVNLSESIELLVIGACAEEHEQATTFFAIYGGMRRGLDDELSVHGLTYIPNKAWRKFRAPTGESWLGSVVSKYPMTRG
ncbi:hypothetical protein ABKA04_001189 [Annulohypoxylon sp. FPYF3050]